MDKRKIIEWHPAFEASIQIEFENEIEKMTFEPDLQHFPLASQFRNV